MQSGTFALVNVNKFSESGLNSTSKIEANFSINLQWLSPPSGETKIVGRDIGNFSVGIIIL